MFERLLALLYKRWAVGRLRYVYANIVVKVEQWY